MAGIAHGGGAVVYRTDADLVGSPLLQIFGWNPSPYDVFFVGALTLTLACMYWVRSCDRRRAVEAQAAAAVAASASAAEDGGADAADDDEDAARGKGGGGAADGDGGVRFARFRRMYLGVYFMMMAGDWLQGPYVYALYDA